MWVKLAIIYTLWLVLSACSADFDLPNVEGVESIQSAPLEVCVSQKALSKSEIVGDFLPEGAEIGVFMRSTTGTRYNGLSLRNAKFTSLGSELSQTWEAAGDPIELTEALGTAYAFYPWQSAEQSALKIPIVNDGTDWMYAQPATLLNVDNPVAQLDMRHAMTIIRCRLVKGDYYQAGAVTTVAVSSDVLAPRACMDLKKAEVSDFEAIGAEISLKKVGSLGEDPLVADLWAIPTGGTGTLRFRMVVDGAIYTAEAVDLTPVAGKVYQVTFTINAEKLAIAGVQVTDWVEKGEDGLKFGVADLWREAKKADGVYAIDKDGLPVPYALAYEAHYAGVVFVVKGKAYQVALVDAIASDGTNALYWWKEGAKDVAQIANHNTSDGVGKFRYLAEIPADPNQWRGGAISDFEGKANTEAILAAQTVNGVALANTIAEALLLFRKNEDCNGGYQDWIIPSQGQLTYMNIKKSELQDLLAKVNGAAFNTEVVYLSSTELHATACYINNFGNNFITVDNKYSSLVCRFIREL